MQAHAILRPARVDGWSDPDPMATLWPGESAESTNRVCFFVFHIQKLIIFQYFHKETQTSYRFQGNSKAAFLHFDHCREGLLRSERGSPGGRG